MLHLNETLHLKLQIRLEKEFYIPLFKYSDFYLGRNRNILEYSLYELIKNTNYKSSKL